MNNRVQELADQARISVPPGLSVDEWVLVYNQKFAELIVQECVQACINQGKTYEIESAGEHSSNLYATAIKKHFGVAE
jgi:hypothetical protein